MKPKLPRLARLLMRKPQLPKVAYVCMHESYLSHSQIYGVKNTQIDRINNDGDYKPSNCHWVTIKEQANNRRDNVWRRGS